MDVKRGGGGGGYKAATVVKIWKITIKFTLVLLFHTCQDVDTLLFHTMIQIVDHLVVL